MLESSRQYIVDGRNYASNTLKLPWYTRQAVAWDFFHQLSACACILFVYVFTALKFAL